MNKPIRRLSIVVMVMMALLLGNITYGALFRYDDLNAHQQNRRARDAEFDQNRGAILVGNTPIARSVPVNTRFKYQREYPGGSLYAPVTGFYSYTYGRSGLEHSYNQQLAGTDNSLFIQNLIDLALGKPPVGASIETTLNAKAQQAAATALGDNKGAIVALNPKTGEILAMVTSPSYNPTQLATHNLTDADAAWKRLNADPNKPMVNRGVREIYPPGSTFKLVTAAAALENGFPADGKVASPSVLTLPGTNTRLGNTQNCGGDQITIDQALRVSCNTAFANLGRQVGAEKLRDQSRKFGFDSRHLPELNGVASRFPEQPDTPQTMMSSIGQFEVAATPLQMAMVVAAIANDGVLMKPYLVKSVRGADLQVLSRTNPQRMSIAMSPANARVLQQWMVNVVEKGTGGPAAVSGVKVGGKSGTAESDMRRAPYAWFVATAENPDVVVCAFVESRSSNLNDAGSSRFAGPMVSKVIEALR